MWIVEMIKIELMMLSTLEDIVFSIELIAKA
jgi:hypothetical protein